MPPASSPYSVSLEPCPGGGATITATVVGLNTGNLYVDGAVESVPHARGSYTASGNTIEWTVSAETTRTGDVSGAVVQRTKFDNIRVKVKLTTSSIPGTGNFVIAGTNHHRFGVDVWTDLAGAEAMDYAWSNFGLAGKKQASGVGSSQTYSPTTWQTVSGKPTTYRFRVAQGDWVSNWNGTYSVEIILPKGPFVNVYSRCQSPGGAGEFEVAGSAVSAAGKIVFGDAVGPNTREIAGEMSPGFEDIVYVEVRNTSEVVQLSYSAFIESGGEFNFDMGSLGDATYRVYIQAEGSLRRRIDVAYTTAGVGELGINLIMGDTDGDNDVDIADAAYVYSVIGKEYLDADWDEPDSNGRYPRVANLDRDGEITSNDHDIVWGNVGLDGD